jgi:hypothetical protein
MSRENIVICNICHTTVTMHYDPMKGWKHVDIRDAFEFSRAVPTGELQIDLCPHCFSEDVNLRKLLPQPAVVRLEQP